MILTHKITTGGSFHCNFTFESEQQAKDWLASEYPLLATKYPGLSPIGAKDIQCLDGLKVGDTCFVYGEGSDTFKIEKIISWGPHRYGFVLDSGCSEEVAKCYKYPSAIQAHTPEADIYDYLQSRIEAVQNQQSFCTEKQPLKPILGYLFGYKKTSIEEADGKKSFKVQFVRGMSETPPAKKLKSNKDYWETVIREGDFSGLYVEPNQYPEYAVSVLSHAKSELEYGFGLGASFEFKSLLDSWADSFKPKDAVDKMLYTSLLYAMSYTASRYAMSRKTVSPECVEKFLQEYLLAGSVQSVKQHMDEFELFNTELVAIQVADYDNSVTAALS